jgi:hypothetical protein
MKNSKWARKMSGDGEKIKKKNTFKTHWSSDSYIIGIIRKILTKQIQHHQERSHQRRPEWVTLAAKNKWASCRLWAACVTHSGRHWWSFLMSLDFSLFFIFSGSPTSLDC